MVRVAEGSKATLRGGAGEIDEGDIDRRGHSTEYKLGKRTKKAIFGNMKNVRMMKFSTHDMIKNILINISRINILSLLFVQDSNFPIIRGKKQNKKKNVYTVLKAHLGNSCIFFFFFTFL